MLTDNILDLIGNTPLIQLKGENIFVKAEFLNPGGSIKAVSYTHLTLPTSDLV